MTSYPLKPIRPTVNTGPLRIRLEEPLRMETVDARRIHLEPGVHEVDFDLFVVHHSEEEGFDDLGLRMHFLRAGEPWTAEVALDGWTFIQSVFEEEPAALARDEGAAPASWRRALKDHPLWLGVGNFWDDRCYYPLDLGEIRYTIRVKYTGAEMDIGLLPDPDVPRIVVRTSSLHDAEVEELPPFLFTLPVRDMLRARDPDPALYHARPESRAEPPAPRAVLDAEPLSSADRALLDAVRADDPNAVRAALAGGADVDVRAEPSPAGDVTSLPDPHGFTPLLFASWFDADAAASALLDAGADVHARTAGGWSVLHLAVERASDDPKVLDRLLAAGAEPDAVTDIEPAGERGTRVSALSMAAARGLAKTAAKLAEVRGNEAPPMPVRSMLRTLHTADTATLETVLNAGVDPYPLFIDADLESLERLLTAGADPNTTGRGSSPRSVLDQFCGAHRPVDFVRRLLEAGAIPTAHGLCRAAASGRREVVELLLAEGLHPDTPNPDGWTALREASRLGRQDVVELLLARGADPSRPDDRGITPIDAALREGHQEVATRLQDALPPTEEPTPERIVQTAQLGDVAALTHLLDAGGDPDSQGPDGAPALVLAAKAGHAATVTLLLERGAHPTGRDRRGRTPLMLAAEAGFASIVERLIAADPRVDVRDTTGKTALGFAAYQGHLDTVRILLAAGADPSLGGPLLAALEKGHEDVASLLIETGANIHARQERSQLRAIDLAVQHSLPTALAALLERGADPGGLHERTGQTPLASGAYNGRLDVVDQLLAAGADPRQKTRAHETAWVLARSRGHQDVAARLKQESEPSAEDRARAVVLGQNSRPKVLSKLLEETPEVARAPGLLSAALWQERPRMGHALLAAGADPNDRDGEGHPVLLKAIEYAARMVPTLLDAGADPGQTRTDGTTALHLAASDKSRYKVLVRLLEMDVDVNARDGRQKTPLHHAAAEGHLKTVRALVGAGAELNAHSRYGETPLLLARKKNREDVARWLETQGAEAAQATTPFDFSIALLGPEDPEVLDRLVEACVDLDAGDLLTGPPITIAIGLGSAYLAQALLRRGASPQGQDGDYSPLGYASQKGDVEIVQALLDHGADVHHRDEESATPLHAAAASGAVEVIGRLLAAGADPEARDARGLRPVDLAELQAQDAAVKTLRHRKS